MNNDIILQDLKQDLVNFVKTNGIPKRINFNSSNGLRDFYTYKKYFKITTILEALEFCGIEIDDSERHSLINRGRPNYCNKEDAIKIIYKMCQTKGSSLYYDDFRNPDQNTIGINTIRKNWGTVNNMKHELGLTVNQENMTAKHIPFEVVQSDIKRICDAVFLNDRRKTIISDDFKTYGSILCFDNYRQHFYRNNASMRDYIDSLGYHLKNPGTGYRFQFDDGEQTTSVFEYKFSRLLRKQGFVYNYSYFRNIKYSDLDKIYVGHMNCDYKIIYNDSIFFVEIAGMLKDRKKAYLKNKKFRDPITQKYASKLRFKEELLRRNNLQFFIYIPYCYKDNDFRDMDNIVQHIRQFDI